MRSILYSLKYFTYGFATSLFLLVTFETVKVHRSTPSVTHEPRSNNGWSSDHSDEQGKEKKLAFVGIMTTSEFLATRAVAGVSTFIADGFEESGFDYAYFVPEGATREIENLTTQMKVIELKGVDDAYPPQKKSLAMVYAMWALFGERYRWFVRLDDDAYLRHSALSQLLRPLNSSKAYILGQAGAGRKEEAGTLLLAPGDTYCMGGTGVVMSRETLNQVAPFLKTCARSLRTFHEDIELSRCVTKFTAEHIQCPKTSEMKTLLRHEYGGKESFSGDLDEMKDLEKAMVVHPLKEVSSFYKVHAFFMRVDLRAKHEELAALTRELAAVKGVLDGEDKTFVHLKQKLTPSLKLEAAVKKGKNRLKMKSSDPLELPSSWEFIMDNRIYATGADGTFPRRGIDSVSKRAIEIAIRRLVAVVGDGSAVGRPRRLRRSIQFRRLVYAYRRYSPRYGVDYVLDLLMTYKRLGSSLGSDTRRKIAVRRHSYVRVPLLGWQVWERHLPAELPVVHFVVPLKGRIATFARFLNNWDNVCPQIQVKAGVGRRCTLTVVFYHESEPNSDADKYTVERLTSRYRSLSASNDSSKQTEPDVRLVTVSDRRFSRGEALEIGAAAGRPDDLLFLVDVDVLVSSEAVERIRLNTIRGKQVWFPVTFSEYDPNFIKNNQPHPSSVIDNRSGFWRIYGFGIVGIYRSDLDAVGGFDRSISGWGKEDVDLYEKIAKEVGNLAIKRAPDPGLVHVFHNITCDPGLAEDQLNMCLGSKATALAPLETLHELARAMDVFGVCQE